MPPRSRRSASAQKTAATTSVAAKKHRAEQDAHDKQWAWLCDKPHIRTWIAPWLTVADHVPLSPVPPLAPMLLDMLNRSRTFTLGGAPLEQGERERLTSLLARPNWWRRLEVVQPTEGSPWSIDAAPTGVAQLFVKGVLHPTPMVLSSLFTSLTDLWLSQCPNFEAGVLAACCSLRRLAFSDCPALTSQHLDGIETLPSLTNLALDDTQVTNLSSNVVKSSSITALDIFSWSLASVGLSGLEGMTALLQLTVWGVATLRLDDVWRCHQLRRLCLSLSQRWDHAFDGIQHLQRLELLYLRPVTRDETYAHLGSCAALTELDLTTAFLSQTGLAYVASLSHLRVLHVTKSEVSTQLLFPGAALARHPSLTHVDMSQCPWVTDQSIPGLETIPQLTKLSLEYCPGLTNVTCLAASTSITELHLRATSVTVEGLQGVETMPSLRLLDLSCLRLRTLNFIAASTSIVELIVHELILDSQDFKFAKRMPQLKRLQLMSGELFRARTEARHYPRLWFDN